MESVDCVVIGAGWFGLAAAKTYIQLHMQHEIVIFDSGSTVGGVWAQERLYPGLRSNNMLGTYEYPDFPMDSKTYGVKSGEHIPGTVVHRYLSDYAARFDLPRRIRFDHRVTTAKQINDAGWILAVESKDGQQRELSTRKLIVATGLASSPHMPVLAGAETFGGSIFHSKDFLQHSGTMDSAHSVVVFGSSKSAWDVAYAYATASTQPAVHLVIRESGRGPALMAPAYVTPLKKWLEKLAHIRFLTWFSPCSWGDEDGYTSVRRFLHRTWLGRQITNAFWHVINNDVLTLMKYDEHPETRKLKPWHTAFWAGSALSIVNYPTDFMELVRTGRIRVHISDVDRLSDGTLHLSSGQDVRADVIVCATGWNYRDPLAFITREATESNTAAALGLPHLDDTPLASDDALAHKIDNDILTRFPRLRDQPVVKPPGAGERPFYLYRFMVPPALVHTRSLAFAGMCSTITTPVCAQAQALWIVAYFNDSLARVPPSVEEATTSAMLHARFCRWRYPAGIGPRAPDFVFEAVPYFDQLLRDLGLNIYRKGSRLQEMVEPYGPEDYKGVVEEWQAAQDC